MRLRAKPGPVGLGLNHGLPLSPNADQPARGRILARLGVSKATHYQRSLKAAALAQSLQKMAEIHNYRIQTSTHS